MSRIDLHPALDAAPTDEREALARFMPQMESLARAQGLDFHPVHFELVPPTFMMEVAVYGLPVRMPHWSFGVRYIHQYVQHRMGDSRIFEVVFPGDPNRAYLEARNRLAENTLVCAHVFGHADFSRHNALFRDMQAQLGDDIVESAARRAQQIAEAGQRHGEARVEAILDAALALEQHVDLAQPLRRPPYPQWIEPPPPRDPGAFESRYGELPGESGVPPSAPPQRSPIPPRPESDLLWFIAQHAPELEGWERDIFLAVREESFYFHPLMACQIMNEGWASYWHARLLREADFLPEAIYLDAIKAHSDVVRPHSAAGSLALKINPYHVGFVMWEHLVETRGLEAARRIRDEEDDFGFVRNYLDEALAHKLQLFAYTRRGNSALPTRLRIDEVPLHELHERLLSPRFHYGAPRIQVTKMAQDGSLQLQHDSATDGRGLDLQRARKVLEYLHRVWRRPLRLDTVDARGSPETLTIGDSGSA